MLNTMQPPDDSCDTMLHTAFRNIPITNTAFFIYNDSPKSIVFKPKIFHNLPVRCGNKDIGNLMDTLGILYIMFIPSGCNSYEFSVEFPDF